MSRVLGVKYANESCMTCQIRSAAADALYPYLPACDVLTRTDWTDKAAFGKEDVDVVRKRVAFEGG